MVAILWPHVFEFGSFCTRLNLVQKEPNSKTIWPLGKK